MSVDLECPGCDHEAARLLPWFVAGALSAVESARVQAHLQECPLCAADERREQRVRALVCSDPPVEHAPQPGLQKLMVRIDELERELSSASSIDPERPAVAQALRSAPLRWLAAAVVLQTIGLGVLGALLWEKNSQLQAPRFSTLSSPAPQIDANAVHIRVVFAPAMTIGEMQTLLVSIPATVAAGPSEAGVYTLALSGRQRSVNPVLERLRADKRVLFAERQSSPGENP